MQEGSARMAMKSRYGSRELKAGFPEFVVLTFHRFARALVRASAPLAAVVVVLALASPAMAQGNCSSSTIAPPSYAFTETGTGTAAITINWTCFDPTDVAFTLNWQVQSDASWLQVGSLNDYCGPGCTPLSGSSDELTLSGETEAGPKSSAVVYYGVSPNQTLFSRSATITVTPSGQTFPVTQAACCAEPITLSILNGDNQTGLVGTLLPEFLTVETSENAVGRVQGVPVTFQITPTVSGTQGARLSTISNTTSVTVQTDSTGTASVPFFMGTVAGATYHITAVCGLCSPTSVTFTETAGSVSSLYAVNPFVSYVSHQLAPGILDSKTVMNSPVATSLAADGQSAVVLVYQSSSVQPVTFTLVAGGSAAASLAPFDPTYLSAPSPPAVPLPLPAVTPINQTGQNCDGPCVFLALLLAPNKMPLPGTSPLRAALTIYATQPGASSTQTTVYLVPPPLLLVHGLWSSAAGAGFRRSPMDSTTGSCSGTRTARFLASTTALGTQRHSATPSFRRRCSTR